MKVFEHIVLIRLPLFGHSQEWKFAQSKLKILLTTKWTLTKVKKCQKGLKFPISCHTATFWLWKPFSWQIVLIKRSLVKEDHIEVFYWHHTSIVCGITVVHWTSGSHKRFLQKWWFLLQWATLSKPTPNKINKFIYGNNICNQHFYSKQISSSSLHLHQGGKH